MIGKIIGHGAKKRFVIDGKDVTQKEFERHFPDKPIGSGDGLFGWKPLVSDALAVHPRQVKEAREDAARKGLTVEFLKDGRPVFNSRQQRRAYMDAYGFYDRQAGYGDAAPGSTRLARDA